MNPQQAKTAPEKMPRQTYGGWAPGRSGVFYLYLIAVCAPVVLVAADESGVGRFRVIIERNAFGLLPPALPVEASAAQPPPDLPQIRLTGIYRQGDLTRVFLVMEPRGQEAERLSLSKGEVHGIVELIEANARNGSVRLRVSGVELDVSFHGQQAAETAARVAEEKFVDDHTKAHEQLQRLLQEQLANEAAAETPSTSARQ